MITLRSTTFVNRLSPRGWVLLGVAIASLLFALLSPASLRRPGVMSDYDPQVERLLEGGGLVDDQGRPLARYPPVYPAIVAWTYASADLIGIERWLALRLVSICSIVLIGLLVFELARMFMWTQSAVAAGLLAGTHPHILTGAVQPLPGTPFTVFLLGGLLAFLPVLTAETRQSRFPYPRMVTAGLLLGLAMLTRPIALPVLILMIAVLLVRKCEQRHQKWRLAAVFALSVLVVVGPWELLVYHGTGRIVPLSTGGVASIRDGLSFNHKERRHPLALPHDVEELTGRFWAHYDRYNSVHAIGSFLAGEVSERPAAVAKLILIKASRAWYGTDTQNALYENVNVLVFILYVPIGVLGMWFCALDKRRVRLQVLFLVTVILSFWLMTAVVFSIVRYMAPVIVLPVAFIPYAAKRLYDRAQQVDP